MPPCARAVSLPASRVQPDPALVRSGKEAGMLRGLSYRALVALAVAVAGALGGASVASATTYTVNTTADTSNAGGCVSISSCSLREAVAAVNAGTGGDTISIPSGRYVLTAGELSVTRSTTIAGNGAATTTV